MPNDLLPPPNLQAIAKAIRTKDQTALKYLCTDTDTAPAALSRVDAEHFTLSRDLFKMCQGLVRRFPQVDHPDTPADAKEAHFLLEHAVRSRQLANREQPAANGLKEGREQDGREPAWMRDVAAIVTASRSYGYAVARTLFSPLLERLTADPAPVLRVIQTPSGEPIFRFSNECRAAFDRLSSTSSHALLLSAVAAAEDTRFEMTRRRDPTEPRVSRPTKPSPTPAAPSTGKPAVQDPAAPSTTPPTAKTDAPPVLPAGNTPSVDGPKTTTPAAGEHPVVAHTVRRQNLIRAAHSFYKEFDIHGAAAVTALQTKEPATHAALFGTVNCLNAAFFRVSDQEGQPAELRISPQAVEAIARQLADTPRDLPARELQCTFRLDAIRENAPGLPKLAKAIAAATDERHAPGPGQTGPEQTEDGPAFGPTP